MIKSSNAAGRVMNPCGKKVAVIFGCLILLAVLFVPYKETKINSIYGCIEALDGFSVRAN